MATQPNTSDASRIGAASGPRKRKPVYDPLNSEVEWLAALLVKKKARLEKMKTDKSGITSKLAKSRPQGGPSHEASDEATDSDDNTGASQHKKHSFLTLSEEESDQEGVALLMGLAPGHQTTSTGPGSMGDSRDEDTEVLVESDEAELGRS
jgi:hypothetical protein